MKAVRLFEFGGPEKLVYGDYSVPEVGPTDVLVKVLATSVSRWDIKYRMGEVHQFYGKSTGHHGGIHGRRAFPMPMQLGRDAAGEVVAVGARVTTLVPGDRRRRRRRGGGLYRRIRVDAAVYRFLAPRRHVCPVGGELHEIPLRVIDMVSKELNVHGIRGATRNDQRVIAELLEKGRIRMPVHAALPLSKAAEAHAILERGDDLVGRIVLHPWENV
jgi:NADPH:quinone reductase-like Zn-dependent oxidoreductase